MGGGEEEEDKEQKGVHDIWVVPVLDIYCDVFVLILYIIVCGQGLQVVKFKQLKQV